MQHPPVSDSSISSSIAESLSEPDGSSESSSESDSDERTREGLRYADWEDRPAVRAFLGEPAEACMRDETHLPYFASSHATQPLPPWFPQEGLPATFVREYPLGDFNPLLNTSSYVNVTFEPEEVEIASLGMRVNIAGQTIYQRAPLDVHYCQD
ncbi:hypothetical protein T492DRAFT_886870 [Pavlovales sp. CCMP2436]|nr:hypothetical protein T492DRAFT_886870 [Pavlovales sp. CCMP2436]